MRESSGLHSWAYLVGHIRSLLHRCGLALNESESKVVSFSRQEMKMGVREGTFSLLGFYFYPVKSRKGNIVPMLQSDPKRMRKKLQVDINYFGVSHNSHRLSTFIFRSIQIVFKQLNRRSQRKSYNWNQINAFLKQFRVPKPAIKHRLW
jgi:hypothetical protein